MTELLLDLFEGELEVEYRGELYRVRDNGAVQRQRRPDQRKRKLDDVWTFGSPNASSGYMHLASVVVHRIVATAFHGEQPSEKHIVDHIDTNRRNNRPENLRWVTRWENLLLNPITARRIVLAYGSLDEFFEDPARPRNSEGIKDFEWMRTVTKEEAEESRMRLLRWAESNQIPGGGALGEWVYGRRQLDAAVVVEEISDIPSLTPMAMQRSWKTPSEFPTCPDRFGDDPLGDYMDRLRFGTVFARHRYGESITVVAERGQGADLISVVSHLKENSVKDWAVTSVTAEDGKFVHESSGSYFTLQGALKTHCSLLGVALGDSIDDYS